AGFDPALPKLAVNRWIIGKLKEATDGTAQAIESYRYNDVADVLYHFTWGTFCDWYLELTKPILQNDEDGDDSEAKIETRATTAWVLDQLLHLLHPVMPYMTEELWQQLDSDRDYSLILGNWPELGDELVDTDANAQMDWLVRLITAIRTARAEMNVPAGAKLPLHYHGASDVTVANMGKHSDLIMRLARIESIEAVTEITEGAVQMVVDEATFVLPIAEVIDLSAEQARLEKEIAKLDSDIDKFTKKLGNEKFVAKAPPEVVETERERLNEANATREKVAEALGRIQAAM
ncbi:MAG: class I tRNA ligase family protein, partial [Rhodospirillales bacterium]|nr:class I tRNA ligase family protein [Rhodospirillales bacterium]